MRILIAEDDLTSRTALMAVLKKQDHEVVAAVNGAEAYSMLLQPNAPLLAILDWVMPEVDGLEVVRRIRARQTERQPYLIILTAKGGKADVIAGLDAGANDYLTKPVDAGELYARIEVGRRMLSLQETLADKIKELYQALDQVKTLRGIVPICASCKKIRDDKGYWNQVEVYVRNHTEAEFSHGICPDCMKRLYPEFAADKTERKLKEDVKKP